MVENSTTSPRKRRGPYAKSDGRRREILAAATQVFGVNGYRAGSLKEIAAVVGMNPTSLLHYFPTKDALLQAVLDERDKVSDEVAGTAVGAAADPADLPKAFLLIAQNNQDVPGIIGLYTLLAAESATPGHPTHEYFVARYERVREQFRRAFARLEAAGLLAPGITAEYAAASTLGLWDGIQMQWMIDPDAVDVVAHLRRHLSMITLAEI
ncbi:AcrR family transcriptional regulator [Microbacterium endophyticum]|uniref:AcrR family transcriptional regulator n=1 Tax=Microbacterium endophyticum TaxID=1526412 RepID=A0A7W4V2Y3_9MICO|nr:TetR/AcrR family transcriptional regulator [Microbacterium endophyticum]MBB2975887.1 AcrR family transcriptional regulator [Microbacterium endophyticum]NIK36370.1 AcrR family transcriptional regulator [Microbacterium endophyticum]